MSEVLLDVQHLQTYLKSGEQLVKAVDDISFQIPKGETFCLVGESGSGKSITALSIMRLLPQGIASHPAGEIWFQGQNLLSLDDAALRTIRGSQIAMIFQEPMTSLNPVFTVGEQIMEALQLHHPELSDEAAQQRTIDALTQVQMPNPDQRFYDYPHQLSGGQRQRVMIAMALACDPELLIADEPTTALDVTVQAEILKLLRHLQAETGMSILLITHDFGVVAQMAQQVGVMQYGKLVEVGQASQVLTAPQHAYTRKLLASVPENLVKPARSSASVTLGTVEQAELPPLIQTQAIKVWFPVKKGIFRRTVNHIKAVDDVSLSIPRGQIVALVGESGCGKTTLGRAIIRLESVTAGTIHLDQQDLTALNQRQLRPLRPKMQMVFQDPQSSLNPRLLIATTLTDPLKVHGIGKTEAERIELAAQALESVQLKRDYLWRYPHEFSGGQRQRIGLARALVLNPEFIVCDEITSALDVSVQAEILQLLLKIRDERNLTLLFITHNISVVEYLSDEIVVMYQGKIVEQGQTADVCRNPQNPYTQKLLAAVPRLH
ncbi:MAG: dipeptide ABC transporter ATP-binding protein [Candidatus Thiocaldithrix dubininis]|uniref:Dipeptide ABC transporter ATP-binding protein n=1 Tax=Candidatus Thiocaldithrix dubininis TaxID=3080823 RepID=A0AA95KDM3_9GAMM|nr:MAG: dipeptide ABC transporter ATP-binding protein [Candidatus Thiocaldithrix dubininis]